MARYPFFLHVALIPLGACALFSPSDDTGDDTNGLHVTFTEDFSDHFGGLEYVVGIAYKSADPLVLLDSHSGVIPDSGTFTVGFDSAYGRAIYSDLNIHLWVDSDEDGWCATPNADYLSVWFAWQDELDGSFDDYVTVPYQQGSNTASWCEPFPHQ